MEISIKATILAKHRTGQLENIPGGVASDADRANQPEMGVVVLELDGQQSGPHTPTQIQFTGPLADIDAAFKLGQEITFKPA